MSQPRMECSTPQSDDSTKFVSLSHESQMFNVMGICDNILFPYHAVAQMCRDHGIRNRACAIEWMMKVMVDECSEIRDASVRIFDTYLTMSYMENPKVLHDTCYIAFASAAAIVLSSKLHSSRKSIDASWFTAFNTEDILFFERQILLKTGSRVSPLATPAFFLHFLTEMSRDCGVCGTQEEVDEVAMVAGVLVSEFWEDPSCLLFAPSTIATTAMIVSLSLHRLTCDQFLDCLPDFLFPDRDYAFFRTDKQAYLDFHRCMLAMETLPTFRAMNCRYGSPTSVAALGSEASNYNNNHHNLHLNLVVKGEQEGRTGLAANYNENINKDNVYEHSNEEQQLVQLSGVKRRLRFDV